MLDARGPGLQMPGRQSVGPHAAARAVGARTQSAAVRNITPVSLFRGELGQAEKERSMAVRTAGWRRWLGKGGWRVIGAFRGLKSALFGVLSPCGRGCGRAQIF